MKAQFIKNCFYFIINEVRTFVSSASIENIVAVIGAVIAACSAVFSYNQAKVAKKSYMMQKDLYEARKSNLIIQDMKNCFLHNDIVIDKIFYFFEIVLANLSDRATSVNKVQLELIDKNKYPIIINSNDNIDIKPMLNRMVIPSNVSPNNSISGWIVFEIPKNVYNEIDIDSHCILIHDINGNVIKREEIYVREEFVGYDF